MQIMPSSNRIFPLSFQQEHIWHSPNRATHNIPPLTIRMAGPLDPEALQTAVRLVAERHQILRARFLPGEDGAPRQTLSGGCRIDLKVKDLRDRHEASRLPTALARIDQHGRVLFDLGGGPVFTAGLIRLSGQDNIFWIVVHHIVADLWSMKLLVREISGLYSAIIRGRAESPAPHLLQYTSYVSWQRDRFRGPFFNSEADFWRRQCEGIEHCLPVDDTGTTHNQGFQISVRTSETLTRSLRTLGRRHGGTLFMTLLTAFKICLFHWTGRSTVFVESLLANRDRAEFEPLIGMLAGTVILRTEARDEMTFGEFLARTRDSCLNSYAHQHLTFGKVAASLQDTGHSIERPEVSFSLQKTPVSAGAFDGLSLSDPAEQSEAPVPFRAVQPPLWRQAWQVWDRGSHLQFLVTYQSCFFRRETIARLLNSYSAMLEAIARNPGCRIFDLRRTRASAPIAREGADHEVLAVL
jgi:hypothetical protein